MLMDYRGADRFPKRNPSWVKRFIHAIHGILYGFHTEKNFRFHVIAAIIVMLVAFLLQISRLEWICVLFAIGIVMGAELLNSAIERTVDLVTEEFHPLAKSAKDLAAGAVFVVSMIAALIGICIFGPYVVQWISILK